MNSFSSPRPRSSDVLDNLVVQHVRRAQAWARKTVQSRCADLGGSLVAAARHLLFWPAFAKWVQQDPSCRNSLNYPPAHLASVIAMGPLFTKASLTQRHRHHGDGEGVGDHVFYVATTVIEPFAFHACTRYACRQFRNSDRSARRQKVRMNGICAVFLGILSHTQFFILNIKAVLF